MTRCLGDNPGDVARAPSPAFQLPSEIIESIPPMPVIPRVWSGPRYAGEGARATRPVSFF
jgi:hypothetical protein